MAKLDGLLYDKVYVVMMHRFGDREGHSYVEGIYSNMGEAVKNLELHEQWRGGKYEGEILEMKLNKPGRPYGELR